MASPTHSDTQTCLRTAAVGWNCEVSSRSLLQSSRPGPLGTVLRDYGELTTSCWREFHALRARLEERF
jgi:hypothetical protein